MRLERALRSRSRAIAAVRWSLRVFAFALLVFAMDAALDGDFVWLISQRWYGTLWDIVYHATSAALVVLSPTLVVLALALHRLRFEFRGTLWRLGPVCVGALALVQLPPGVVIVGAVLRSAGFSAGHDVQRFVNVYFTPAHTPLGVLGMVSTALLALLAGSVLLRRGTNGVLVGAFCVCMFAGPSVDLAWTVVTWNQGPGVWIIGPWWTIAWSGSSLLAMVALLEIGRRFQKLLPPLDGSLCPVCFYPTAEHEKPICPECGTDVGAEVERIAFSAKKRTRRPVRS